MVITEALEIVVREIASRSSFDRNKKTMVVLGVDEFKKLGDEKGEKMRHALCVAVDSFCNNQDLDNLEMRALFTSLLPSDVPSLPALTGTFRYILRASLVPLSRQVVERKLMKEFYEMRTAFRAAIHCCIGHQRSLELLHNLLKTTQQKNENPHWFQHSDAPIYDRGNAGQLERDILQQILARLTLPLAVYMARVSWELLEPCFTGREITPFIEVIERDSTTVRREFECPQIIEYSRNKDGKLITRQSTGLSPFINMFANSIFINELPQPTQNPKDARVTPQSNL